MTVSKILLLAALCEVRGEVYGDFLEPMLQTKGICAATMRHIDTDDDIDAHTEYLTIMAALFTGWEKHSGSMSFPVPGDELDSTPCAAFFRALDNGHMWYGEYGEKRRELLTYAIDKLKKELTQ